jgi:hypothetical protein
MSRKWGFHLVWDQIKSKYIVECYEKNPSLCRRWWSFFTHLFSAGVSIRSLSPYHLELTYKTYQMIVGSTVVRNPSRPTAGQEIVQLQAATDLYSKVAARKTRGGRYGQVILSLFSSMTISQNNLQIILAKLLSKATKLYHSHLFGADKPLERHRDPSDDTELAIFGGHGIVHKDKTGSSKTTHANPSMSHNSCEGLNPSQYLFGPNDTQYQADTTQTRAAELMPHSFDVLAGSYSGVPASCVTDWNIAGLPQWSINQPDLASLENDVYPGFLDAEIGLTREGGLLDSGWDSFIQDIGIFDNSFST